ncbi:SRPBCC family protein [Paraburkholderia metrosideri]|uniref:DUF1828 domain-containing protein n=1 Tax=Paraburkholderia metrosideri TaxID=580937 RepID=A0ABM8P9R6_9BURK|nr:SRPBCC family protein [Paraburkholderia metrosideri]CAD6560113.1 hypothetical protein LMG28140_06775 [Paraburkholderia metrosideri]
MARRLHVSDRIVVDAPVDQAFMFFTPAGEELWLDGRKPTYVHPTDGRTDPGMVFLTGHGDELTDFDRNANRSRYVRSTLASRISLVEVHCAALDEVRTEVEVSYTLTALNAARETALEDFEGQPFTSMIDDWARRIAACREVLLVASIR